MLELSPFLILTLIFGIANVTMSVIVVQALKNRGIQASLVWARFKIVQYLNQYRDATTEERGKPGFLFYSWIITIDLAFLSFIIALIVG
jgi:hypothetical protein